MTDSDRHRQRLEKLEALKRENGIGPQSAAREERTGTDVARREELAKRKAWKAKGEQSR